MNTSIRSENRTASPTKANDNGIWTMLLNQKNANEAIIGFCIVGLFTLGLFVYTCSKLCKQTRKAQRHAAKRASVADIDDETMQQEDDKHNVYEIGSLSGSEPEPEPEPSQIREQREVGCSTIELRRLM